MSYQAKCTIYKPIPIFKTEYSRGPLWTELLRFNLDFNDTFKEWMTNNLKGSCTIVDYTDQMAILEFELQEDFALFNLTWR
jgi:hypothetical protein